MIHKQVESPEAAVADIADGATVMIGGFGEAGSPIELIHALVDQGARHLTVISNNTGSGRVGLAALIANGQVRKMICSYPRSANSTVFPELYRRGEIELELVPPSASGPAARASPPFTPPALSALSSPTARNRANSRDVIISWNMASAPTSPSSRPPAPIAMAIWFTTKPRAIFLQLCAWPPKPPSPKSRSWPEWVKLIPRRWSRPEFMSAGLSS
jgi:hypothetical protein